jgi:hypothetical protein
MENCRNFSHQSATLDFEIIEKIDTTKICRHPLLSLLRCVMGKGLYYFSKERRVFWQQTISDLSQSQSIQAPYHVFFQLVLNLASGMYYKNWFLQIWFSFPVSHACSAYCHFSRLSSSNHFCFLFPIHNNSSTSTPLFSLLFVAIALSRIHESCTSLWFGGDISLDWFVWSWLL